MNKRPSPTPSAAFPAPAAPDTSTPPASRPSDDDQLFLSAVEGVAPLADRGEVPLPPEAYSTPPQARGIAPNLDPRLLRALRRGQYRIEDRLDLHGSTRAEAQRTVERFLLRSRERGLRCVLIIHGRGLHSEDGVAVLKGELDAWLREGKLASAVLAFAPARPRDGGDGALYVLLRR